MPSADVLAAAAALAAEMEEMERLRRQWEEEENAGPDIGPPPPELMAELDAAPDDERGAEVVRVLRVLAAAAEAGDPEPNPWAVLGLEHSAGPGEVKKRYWRVSLLVHPDKCGHARANEAFQAAAAAANTLQDPAARAALEGRAAARRQAKAEEEMAAQAEREEQWRVLRAGGTLASAAAAAAAARPPGREEWMTALPPERKAGAVAQQKNVKAFSMKGGPKPRGDTSGWTDTPQMRVERQLAALRGAADATLALDAGPAARAEAAEAAAAREAADAVRKHHEGKRSLVEAHAAAADQAKRKAKKSKKGVADAPGENQKEDWAGKHPWRPFNRETDLEIKPRSSAVKQVMADASKLHSRFSSAGS